ncbi:hypothetical protein FH609_008190 [Streptomyces sp. 3MP-14]|uniref:DUF308 domain-containing protein n=1 Tax=Streptomyces mimosae TaxID=2586635 RepID=A0A5N6AIH7_9ACTN|nr:MULTISPECIES: hypothetical protein [Streptomyces]KAB8168637.1 hypothetical protein FH607_005175 [Streptomyces mimosae]KAB8178083.1 hypothetical protein FH609_008190 [Streptomyces sp. 3MP-14]
MTERDQERGDGRDPIDEEAAWAEIVAGYGEEPADPPGLWPRAEDVEPVRRVEAAEGLNDALNDGPGVLNEGPPGERPAGDGGPRDWVAEEEDEGHFEPPEPPPLPPTDLTTKLSWLAVLGGPLLLVFTVLFQQQMTWWVVTLGVGGFLGGFASLVSRMRDGDDDWQDPGNGAVV